MSSEIASHVEVKNLSIDSVCLNRKVLIDIYHPLLTIDASTIDLLLINDGQDLPQMDFAGILDEMIGRKHISPIICVGIHAGPQRKMEYGIAGIPDFKGRGDMAIDYTSFVFTELLPFLVRHYGISRFRSNSFAGFSLGGLMAIDIVWTHPREFMFAAVFSGSLWWRSLDQTEPEYDDNKHRIIHQLIRKGNYHPGLKFFFQCGNKDENRDRNNNGIIDSIDDTRDLIKELINKGYDAAKDIYYLEMEDGSHDVPTWGRAFPTFLKWAFSNSDNT